MSKENSDDLMSGDFEKKLKEVYGAHGDRELLDQVYDEWATSGYDQDLWASGNPYIAIINGIACRHLPDFDARILDAGCGTGLLGHVLYQTGFRNIDGLDASAGMLDAARKKTFYSNLYQMLLGARIDLPPDTYDGIVASGVITQGHAPPESLDGLLGIAKPNAPIIFSISRVTIDEGGFGDKMRALESQGAWKLIEQTEPFRTFPFSEEYADLRHWVCVYKKTG